MTVMYRMQREKMLRDEEKGIRFTRADVLKGKLGVGLLSRVNDGIDQSERPHNALFDTPWVNDEPTS